MCSGLAVYVLAASQSYRRHSELGGQGASPTGALATAHALSFCLLALVLAGRLGETCFVLDSEWAVRAVT